MTLAGEAMMVTMTLAPYRDLPHVRDDQRIHGVISDDEDDGGVRSSHPSVSAVSMPKSTSTFGTVFNRTALNGGTSMRKGALRFMQ